ncbi:hypothetical protein KCP75_05100 [Salmonella enterica subsp. enterica]|nr:hypothetical protein KCP75_05100 [Salmonella enterica subsp. enterica]
MNGSGPGSRKVGLSRQLYSPQHRFYRMTFLPLLYRAVGTRARHAPVGAPISPHAEHSGLSDTPSAVACIILPPAPLVSAHAQFFLLFINFIYL